MSRSGYCSCRARPHRRQAIQLAASCCITIKEFKQLPSRSNRRYGAPIWSHRPTNMGRSRPGTAAVPDGRPPHRRGESRDRPQAARGEGIPAARSGPWPEGQGIPSSFAHQAMSWRSHPYCTSARYRPTFIVRPPSCALQSVWIVELPVISMVSPTRRTQSEEPEVELPAKKM